MLSYLRHLVRENFQEILDRSLLNCHAKGVHSLIFSEISGRTIRMFHATKEHDLDRNADAILSRDNPRPMSVGFHPHRNNITFHVMRGKLNNIVVKETTRFDAPRFNKFRYMSKIVNGEIGFKLDDVKPLRLYQFITLTEGQSDALPADMCHTIHIEHGQSCSWLVFEGREDRGYENVCYSNADLEKEKFEGLYQRPTEEQVRAILKECGI